MAGTGLVAKRGLDAEDVAQVRELAEICRRVDGIALKLNWDMRNGQRSDHLSDFCCYRDGRLAGYMPLDGFGGKFEITAVVQPDCRQQGLFRLLFEAARQEARQQEATQLLLVNYRASESGTAVVRRLGVAYEVSEYCMEADASAIPPLPPTQLHLEEVTTATAADLSRMLDETFEHGGWTTADALRTEIQRDNRRYYLARLEGAAIGQIGVLAQENGVYIRAVGIAPQWRGRGYGRQLLALTVHKMLAEGHHHFELDVETENSRALSLYQFCGFHETNVYDYYTVPLSIQT